MHHRYNPLIFTGGKVRRSNIEIWGVGSAEIKGKGPW